jgi:hypothetical protein
MLRTIFILLLLLLLLRWLYSPMWTFASLMDLSQSSLIDLFQGHILGFLTVDFFWGGVVSPMPNQPGGPGIHIYTTWRLDGPVIPPDTKYPF